MVDNAIMIHGQTETIAYVQLVLQDGDVRLVNNTKSEKYIIIYLDINECKTKPNACHSPAVCKNTNGSYTCECNATGHRLAYDGKSCVGKE